MHRATVALALLAMVMGSVHTGAAPGEAFPLPPGVGVFWDGPYIEHLTTRVHPLLFAPRDDSCGREPSPCIDHPLDVGPSTPGSRLRVALDMDSFDHWFRLRLIDPDGNVVAQQDTEFSAEVFATDPVQGRWVARVIVMDAKDVVYRARAMLEPPAPTAEPGRLLPPNLRAEPPFEFTFKPPLGVKSPLHPTLGGPSSCAPDEIAENGARRCLRFSFGYGNRGDGPLDLRFSPLADVSSDPSVTQRVHRADGSYVERPAGTYSYHVMHTHYHYDDVFAAQVYRVLDPERGLVGEPGPLEKRGNCGHDWKMVDWHRFFQGPRDQDESENCRSLGDARLLDELHVGLTSGWADIYGWQLPDNYVEFSDRPDGCYLVVATADPDDRILESDDRDNDAYALVEVSGLDVRVVERGYGASPWDPRKDVVQSGTPCPAAGA